MIRVNLLGHGGGARRKPFVPKEQRAALLGASVLVATALAVAGGWWSLDRERGRLDAEIAAAETAVTRLQDAARLVERAAARQKDLKERLALIDRLQATERDPVTLLQTVSESLSDGLWLIELRQQTGGVVQIEGRATSLTALTDFVERLQTSGRFARPLDILTTTMESVGETSVVRFAVRGEGKREVALPPTAGGRPGV